MRRKVRKLHVTVEFDTYTVLDPRMYPSGYAKSTNYTPRLRTAINKAVRSQVLRVENFKVDVEGFEDEEKQS